MNNDKMPHILYSVLFNKKGKGKKTELSILFDKSKVIIAV